MKKCDSNFENEYLFYLFINLKRKIITTNEKVHFALDISKKGRNVCSHGTDIYSDSARSWHSLTRASTFAPRIPAEGRSCDHLTLWSRSRISWYVMFARYPRSLNSARRDAPVVSSPCVSSSPPPSLSLSLSHPTIIGNYKDSIPSHKGSKTLLFSFFFLRGRGTARC